MKRERWVEKQDFLGLLWVLSLVVGSAAGGQIFFFFAGQTVGQPKAVS